MKKFFIVFAVVLAVIAVVFTIIVLAVKKEQRQILSREFDIEPTDKIIVSKQASYLDGTWLYYSYEIDFGGSEYDEVMEKLFEFAKTSESFPDVSIPKVRAKGIGIPYKKYWLDTDSETIIWWYNAPCLLIVVTQDTAENYHAYIEWKWTPFWSMIN